MPSQHLLFRVTHWALRIYTGDFLGEFAFDTGNRGFA